MNTNAEPHYVLCNIKGSFSLHSLDFFCIPRIPYPAFNYFKVYLSKLLSGIALSLFFQRIDITTFLKLLRNNSHGISQRAWSSCLTHPYLTSPGVLIPAQFRRPKFNTIQSYSVMPFTMPFSWSCLLCRSSKVFAIEPWASWEPWFVVWFLRLSGMGREFRCITTPLILTLS